VTELSVNNVVADPKKPWKAIAAAVFAFLGLFWANLQGVEDLGTLDLMDWVTIIIPTLVTFGATYFVENPKVVKTR
jgi:hypothetical protein